VRIIKQCEKKACWKKQYYSEKTGLLASLRSCGKAPWGPLRVILFLYGA